jgi:hypothetical protein
MDRKPVLVSVFDSFFGLMHDPGLPGLPGRPQGKKMAAFFRIADQLFRASVHQIVARHAEVGFAVHGAVGIKASHFVFMLFVFELQVVSSVQTVPRRRFFPEDAFHCNDEFSGRALGRSASLIL